MNRLALLLTTLLLAAAPHAYAQRNSSIKINEVMTDNQESLLDEYGERSAWIEVANISFSTYNIRGMYLTTDRTVLDKQMSAPERMKRMCIIPSGEKRTELTARQHILFYANSNPQKGSLHLNLNITPGQPTWIAIYDGNGVDLIDSVSVPALAPNTSYARVTDGAAEWVTRTADDVTPDITNQVGEKESKIAKIKRDDPYGFGITILSMGIVFACLALLFLFFWLLGIVMGNTSKKAAKKIASVQPMKAVVKTGEKVAETGHKTNVILKDGLHSKGIDKEIYIAVISMALKQYQDDVHDMESGIITIKHKDTHWHNF